MQGRRVVVHPSAHMERDVFPQALAQAYPVSEVNGLQGGRRTVMTLGLGWVRFDRRVGSHIHNIDKENTHTYQEFDRPAHLSTLEAQGFLGPRCRSRYTIIGAGARVVGCPRVVDAFVGPGAGRCGGLGVGESIRNDFLGLHPPIPISSHRTPIPPLPAQWSPTPRWRRRRSSRARRSAPW